MPDSHAADWWSASVILYRMMMDAFKNALSGIPQGEDPASYGQRIPEPSAKNESAGQLTDTSETSGNVGSNGS